MSKCPNQSWEKRKYISIIWPSFEIKIQSDQFDECVWCRYFYLNFALSTIIRWTADHSKWKWFQMVSIQFSRQSCIFDANGWGWNTCFHCTLNLVYLWYERELHECFGMFIWSRQLHNSHMIQRIISSYCYDYSHPIFNNSNGLNPFMLAWFSKFSTALRVIPPPHYDCSIAFDCLANARNKLPITVHQRDAQPLCFRTKPMTVEYTICDSIASMVDDRQCTFSGILSLVTFFITNIETARNLSLVHINWWMALGLPNISVSSFGFIQPKHQFEPADAKTGEPKEKSLFVCIWSEDVGLFRSIF